MRAIFVGIFILALLAGITAKLLSYSSNDETFMGSFLKSVGYKKNQELQRKQIQDYARQFSKRKETLMDYIKDQQDYIESSQNQMSALTQMVKTMSERDKNFDLLHIKDLMNQYEDRRNLLIENGRRIIEFNEQNKKINQTMYDKSSLDAIVSNSNAERMLQNLKDKLNNQEDLLNQQVQNTQALNDKIQQIKEQVQIRHEEIAFKEKPQFLEKLESLSNNTQSLVQNVKEKQNQIQEIYQRNLTNVENMNERMRDLKQKNIDNSNRNSSAINGQAMNDHVRDQIERLKELRAR